MRHIDLNFTSNLKQPLYVIVLCVVIALFIVLDFALCWHCRASIIHLRLFVFMVPWRVCAFIFIHKYIYMYRTWYGHTWQFVYVPCIYNVNSCSGHSMYLLMCKHFALFIQFLSSFICNSVACFRLYSNINPSKFYFFAYLQLTEQYTELHIYRKMATYDKPEIGSITFRIAY